MKLAKPTNKKAAKATKAPKTAKVEGPTITVENFDCYLGYVGKKVPTATIRKEAVGLVIPKLPQHGYLVIAGDKPGILVHAVKHNGDIYERFEGDTKVYGSLNALNGIEHDGFSGEFLTTDELVARAKKLGKAAKVMRRADKQEFSVNFLNSPGDSYVGGITRVGGKFTTLNMEPPRPYNKKGVQFDTKADIDAKKNLGLVSAAA